MAGFIFYEQQTTSSSAASPPHSRPHPTQEAHARRGAATAGCYDAGTASGTAFPRSATPGDHRSSCNCRQTALGGGTRATFGLEYWFTLCFAAENAASVPLRVEFSVFSVLICSLITAKQPHTQVWPA
jgi:hypothetical protein